MKNRKTFFLILLSLILVLSACTSTQTEENTSENNTEEEAASPAGSIILATTTSTQDTGLLDYLLPLFTEETNIEVKTIAVGSGKAIQMARDGEADVLLVHAKPDELKLVEEGFATERRDVMYNDFILVGPADGKLQKGNDILAALKEINDNKLNFVSRGDDSGTHKKELSLWKLIDVEPTGEWYIETGSGMGDTLKVADEKRAYTIADRGTYLSLKDTLDLDIIVEGDENLFNQYGVLPVNPEKFETINYEGAVKFMEWITREDIQQLIGEYGIEEYGQALFIPNYK
ncbi:tungsten ABC transporter substrate-binding protein [Soehngenia longivitae]|uniref:Tungsten ABC transporter substrate-binding protein n=1 Tax=Soehngenia longivitae TaxID=2562294 RepID=A0A4Z0D900_9FIRM|nr:substrate-binding domain-containing protein [Soehngenia longivitae]TFZ41378.1 tungsten ABC transporter substrate-binding protein [Soehngenia longivitae]